MSGASVKLASGGHITCNPRPSFLCLREFTTKGEKRLKEGVNDTVWNPWGGVLLTAVNSPSNLSHLDTISLAIHCGRSRPTNHESGGSAGVGEDCGTVGPLSPSANCGA